jgi:hypothetical protein
LVRVRKLFKINYHDDNTIILHTTCESIYEIYLPYVSQAVMVSNPDLQQFQIRIKTEFQHQISNLDFNFLGNPDSQPYKQFIYQ